MKCYHHVWNILVSLSPEFLRLMIRTTEDKYEGRRIPGYQFKIQSYTLRWSCIPSFGKCGMGNFLNGKSTVSKNEDWGTGESLEMIQKLSICLNWVYPRIQHSKPKLRYITFQIKNIPTIRIQTGRQGYRYGSRYLG